ncbi:GNAT family N-acetyltransferase [Sphingobacterium zeae]|uniref:L-amino acid N-acyltransferase YncA n=1 Tax=Sphingobacterium zeae TaxID=1776859 RepID=A0ABU0U2P6_9SPHI|nr:GNAT family N-acetyltransferase [Sphingobacterium zeae]MDQ1149238.1 L-amino acid N-acyltransferase YncA [Sphingobacterium zeae]
MNQLKFRNAEQQDLPYIVEIYNSTIASRMVTADTEPVSVASRQKWFDEHSALKRPLWMVEDENNQLLGWVSFQSFYGRPAYDATVEISIYLNEQQRGRGLGKQILQYCMDKAPDFGVHTLLGFIFAHNLASIALFEKMGFEEWANLPNIATLDQEERSLKILGIRIK